MSNEYKPQHISPKQLENVIAILNDQKKKEESETCAICFQDYLVKNTKDHQCPDENIYTISFTFTTDRPLSEIELETLKMQTSAQIEEPVNSDGDDVDYITNLIEEN